MYFHASLMFLSDALVVAESFTQGFGASSTITHKRSYAGQKLCSILFLWFHTERKCDWAYSRLRLLLGA